MEDEIAPAEDESVTTIVELESVIVVFVQGVVVPLSLGMIDDEIAPARDDDGKPEKLAGNDQELLEPQTPVPVPIGPTELLEPQTPVPVPIGPTELLPDGYGYGGALTPPLAETTPIELLTAAASEDEMPADEP